MLTSLRDALVKMFLDKYNTSRPDMTDLENPLKNPAPRELPLGYCLWYFECSGLVFPVLVLFQSVLSSNMAY